MSSFSATRTGSRWTYPGISHVTTATPRIKSVRRPPRHAAEAAWGTASAIFANRRAWTQQQLADAAGIGRVTLVRIENGLLLPAIPHPRRPRTCPQPSPSPTSSSTTPKVLTGLTRSARMLGPNSQEVTYGTRHRCGEHQLLGATRSARPTTSSGISTSMRKRLNGSPAERAAPLSRSPERPWMNRCGSFNRKTSSRKTPSRRVQRWIAALPWKGDVIMLHFGW